MIRETITTTVYFFPTRRDENGKEFYPFGSEKMQAELTVNTDGAYHSVDNAIRSYCRFIFRADNCNVEKITWQYTTPQL